jgi:antitoxin VapB
LALSIKNEATERLARLVAQQAGESITEAIQRSLAERLERIGHKRQNRRTREALLEILRRVDALPTLDTRTEDEILGYDERGVPHSW